MTDWFAQLFGFPEGSFEDTQKRFEVFEAVARVPGVPGEGDATPSDTDYPFPELRLRVRSQKSGHSWGCGRFGTPQLSELRARNEERLRKAAEAGGKLRFHARVGEAQAEHAAEANRFATMQVASQFNCLEFVQPGARPEDGVTRYASDKTQGPACCLCTGPAIVYRNYLHVYEKLEEGKQGGPNSEEEEEGKNIKQQGQRAWSQLDNLRDVSRALGNDSCYWTMKGGYTLSSREKLHKIPWARWESAAWEELKGFLRIGVHEDVEVTACGNWGLTPAPTSRPRVSHALCAAAAIAYNRGTDRKDWEKLAKLILQASYEATFYAALETAERHGWKFGSKKLLLTSVGGGVFGNPSLWINEAIFLACEKFKHCSLDVSLVCFREMSPDVRKLEKQVRDILH